MAEDDFNSMVDMEAPSPSPGDILKGIQAAMASYGSVGHQPYVEIMSPQEYNQRVERFKRKEREDRG